MIQLMGPGAREDIDATSTSNSTRPVCAWGMDGGITNPRGYQFDELCCHAGYQGLTLCAHEGCNAKVHHRCQWAWLRNKSLAFFASGPIYCPVHNIQRGDYIRQYYRSRGMNIPREVLVLLPIIPDTSDINPSVEPGVRTAQQSAAPIGPGVRNTSDIDPSVEPGVQNAQRLPAPKEEDCEICHTNIDLNDRSTFMKTQCKHIFHRICLERWFLAKVRFLIWFLQRWRMHILLAKQLALTIVALFPCLT
jgi:hypothetical protein